MELFSNKELAFISTLPITMWAFLFILCFIVTLLNHASFFTLTIYFNNSIYIIMTCFLYGLVGLIANRAAEIYYEKR